jgi:hypothetical protein
VNWYLDDVFLETSTAIQANATGTYRAESVLNGCSASASISMIVSGVEAATSAVQAYPNPFLHFIKVSGNVQSAVLEDLTGRALMLERMPNEGADAFFDTSFVAPGIYLLRVQRGSTISTIKVAKQ